MKRQPSDKSRTRDLKAVIWAAGVLLLATALAAPAAALDKPADPTPVPYQVPDSTAPVLTGLTTTPTSVDVSDHVAWVEVGADATDDVVGVGSVVVRFTPPGVVPDPFPGGYPIPMMSPPPVPMMSGSSSPLMGGGSGTSSGSGVVYPGPTPPGSTPGMPSIYPMPYPVPGSSTSRFVWLSQISGLQPGGPWRGTVEIPQYALAGDWSVDVWMSDFSGNWRTMTSAELHFAGFPSSLTVGGRSDKAAPAVAGLHFTPASIDVRDGNAVVDIDLRATDDLSGVTSILVTFTGPTATPLPVPPTPLPYVTGSVGGALPAVGSPIDSIAIMPPVWYPSQTAYLQPAQGSPVDGLWRGRIWFSSWEASGNWTAEVTLRDAVGNSRTLSSADLKAAGLPSSLGVLSNGALPYPKPLPPPPPYDGSGVVVLPPMPGADGGGMCYKLDGGVETTGTRVPVGTGGTHIIEYWPLDSAGNAGPHETLTFTVGQPKAASVTIAVDKARVALGKAFVLSGVLSAGVVGDACRVEVKKPGSARWSYSSARTAYSSAGAVRWWYRYVTKRGMARGTYSFRVKVAADASRKAAISRVVSVVVR